MSEPSKLRVENAQIKKNRREDIVLISDWFIQPFSILHFIHIGISFDFIKLLVW